MLPTNVVHDERTERLEVTMKDDVGNDVTLRLGYTVWCVEKNQRHRTKMISNVFLSVRFISNECVSEIIGCQLDRNHPSNPSYDYQYPHP